MPTHLRISPIVLFVAVVVSPAVGQEPIRFARTPAISPDGQLIAFSYLGDIWTVEAIGGVARPLTMHEAHEYAPCFSPDGRHVAFASNRYGSYDVFVSPVRGGRPTRLTFDSAQDVPTGWTPDGKHVVFTSDRSAEFPRGPGVYTVPADGGRERRLQLFEAKEAYFAPDGRHIAFVRGPGTWYRRGYRGSSNDDIWLAGADGSHPRKLTEFDGQDTSPMWSPDGRSLFYVTEVAGTPGVAGIVRQDFAEGEGGELVASGPPRPLTEGHSEPIRRAKIGGHGEWIVYECGAEIWVVNTRTGSARPVPIEVHADDKVNPEETRTHTNGATDYALSPDESHAVIVVHGELFLLKLPVGGKATRLTENPAFDHSPSWSADGKKVLFASDRTGVEDLYLLEADDPEHPELTKAHRFKVTQLTKGPEEESAATFAPKGDVIAFLRAGKLWTIKPDGTGEKVLVGEPKVTDYDWSPDGKWVAYSRTDGSFASELYVVPADGSAPPRNVTRYATYNGDVTWSRTGGKLAFVGLRRGTYSMHVLSLQRPTAPGAKPPPAGEIDWEDIHLRVTRPAATPAETGAISPDGSQVAFRSDTGSSGDLWVVSADGGNLSRVTSGGQNPRGIRWSKKTAGLVYFLNRTGELRTARIPPAAPASPADTLAARLSALGRLGTADPTPGPGATPGQVPFVASLTVRREEEFAEMFAQCWRALADQFYDPRFHGADWDAVREKYRPLVDHVARKEDLYAVVSLMLGELNASHLGIGGQLPRPDQLTAELGLIFDEKYPGPGLKVVDVLKRGPADRRGLSIEPGDIVLAIDRAELTDRTNLSQLLNGKAGETVLLEVTSDPANPKARRKIEFTPADRDKVAELMYDRWVERNADQVARQSRDRLGYIHIPSMDERGLEAFVRALYSDNFDKEALILDVRYNGGGFTHDQILNYLTGKEHTFFRQRNGGEGLVLRSFDRKWTKPAVVVINNRSYSDAEIFPHAFRAVGAGKVVGQATGGYVIGTGRTRLIDGSEFRLPRVGVYTADGVNMEKEGVQPDVPAESDPADWAKGIDTQLTKAVEVLKADVIAWRLAKGAPPEADASPAARTAPDRIPLVADDDTPLATPEPERVPPPARLAPAAGGTGTGTKPAGSETK